MESKLKANFMDSKNDKKNKMKNKRFREKEESDDEDYTPTVLNSNKNVPKKKNILKILTAVMKAKKI